MRRKAGRAALSLLLLVSLLAAGQKVKVKERDLPPRQREWLKLVSYIILPQEREVFFQLANDRERDLFIETFWKQRDPTPGTPRNEYKEEILERFNYANKRFRYSSKEGWMTDRGRIYIILGPPVSIDRYPASPNIYPCEVWSYYGDPAKDLPSHFSLVFFQRGGSGEYQLYDPVADGPAALLVEGRNMDPFDYERLYETIRERAPALATVCLSLIPGDIPFNFQPSIESTTILANIYESPKKDVNPTYSTHFLNYRGLVSTEYLTNYVECTTETAYILDPVTGIPFLHFAVAPLTVSVDYYEPRDQYFCNYTVTVSLRSGKETIFQYDKEFPVYFDADELSKVRANGISLEDSFPVVPGEFELNILLRNSVGKEFSVFEQKISVPPPSRGPGINGPFLGYRFEEYSTARHMPFKAAEKKLLVDPKYTFSRNEDIALLFNITGMTQDLWRSGEVRIQVRGTREENPPEKSYILKLGGHPFRRMLSIGHSIPAADLTPDYYQVKVRLLDGGGNLVDEGSAEFALSPSEGVSHPIARMKAFPLHNQFLYFYILADQYGKLGKKQEADAYFERAYTLNPGYKKGIREYAEFLLKNGEYGRCLNLVENLKDDEQWKFDYYLIKGQANMGLERYMQAIDLLLEGNKIYNSDTRLLNSLGYAYYKTAQKEKALEVLNASLRLNPEQEEVKKLIREIQNTLND